MTIIDTARLRLRPWRATDAPHLYELAKDPRIGLACGWAPHTSIEDAHQALSTVLSSSETYAVTQLNGGELVGAIGLRIDDPDVPGVADLGYWIGSPYWGRGYATEAGHAIIGRARELGVKTIVLKYFDGNSASRRVSEKLGFAWRSREEGVEYPLIGKRLTVHRTELVFSGR
mgnify:FL=1